MFLRIVAHVLSVDLQNPIVRNDLPRFCRCASCLHFCHLAPNLTVCRVSIVVCQTHPQFAARRQHDFELQTKSLPLLALLVMFLLVRLDKSGNNWH